MQGSLISNYNKSSKRPSENKKDPTTETYNLNSKDKLKELLKTHGQLIDISNSQGRFENNEYVIKQNKNKKKLYFFSIIHSI